jgi:hypothetical protein
MARITLDVPDALAPRVSAAFMATFNYDEEIDGEPTAANRLRFVEKHLKRYLRDVTLQHEVNLVVQTTRDTEGPRLRDELAGVG